MSTDVVEGSHQAVQRAGRHSWQVPVTGFWQAHRDAARTYSDLVSELGPTRYGHDRVGSLRRRRAFRRGPGRRGGRVRTRAHRRQRAGGVTGSARNVGRSSTGAGG